MRKKINIVMLTLLFLVGIAAQAFAVTTTWDGSTGAVWTDATNWSAGVPTALDDAVIPLVGTPPIISAAGAVCNTLTINAAAGATTLTITNPGTLTITSAGSITSAATSAANNAIITGTGGVIAAGTLTITNSASGIGVLTISTASITGNVANAITFTGAATNGITVSAAILDGTATPVTVNMTALANVVTFSGANTYTGATTITSGMLTTVGAARIPDTSPVNIAGAAANAGLTIGANETIGALSGTGNITLGLNTLTVSQTTNTTYSGVIGVGGTAGILVKSGTGVLTLSGANAYIGATTVSGGTLKIGASASPLGTIGGATTVSAGAALDLNGFTLATAEPLTLNGTGVALGGALMNSGAAATYSGLITLGSASSIVGGTGTINISNAGAITGAGLDLTLGGAQGGTLTSILGTVGGGLIKAGNGTWRLAGVNTYTGATTVSAGTLLYNAVMAGANNGTVTVASGATVGGTGTIAGAVVVSTGGILKPGDGGVGTLSALLTVSFNNGAIFNVDVSNPIKDLLAVTGNMTVNAGAILQMGTQNGTPSATYEIATALGNITAFSSASLPAGWTQTTTAVHITLTAPASGAAVTSVTPTNVPRGAYVNGPLGNSDDNYFFQKLTITTSAVHATGSTIAITLPAGMNVADIVATDYTNSISVGFVEAAGTADLTLTPTATSSVITLTVGGATGIEIGDVIYVMFPITSDMSAVSGEYTVDFSGGAADDITTGNGPTVTFVNPGPNSVADVAFLAPLSGVPDTTETDGEVWPAIGTAAHSALQDLLFDQAAGGTRAANLPAEILLGFKGTESNATLNDVIYRYYAARDDTLSHVDKNDTGVIPLYNYSPASNFANEGFTGNQGLTVANLPEGDWYIYIISDITGNFPLGRSGRLTVRHWPQVDVLAWDRDGSGTLISGSVNTTDSDNITLDSGRYVGYDGTVFGTDPATDVDIFMSVDDFDDNAKVSLWRSTSSALTSADIQTAGTSPNLTVTGIGATAVSLVDTLWENSEDQNGYLVWNLENLGTGTIIPAGEYTLYAVANDGKHQYIRALQGFDSTNVPTYSGTSKYSLNIKHSPNLTINSLDEYNKGTDTNMDADVTIDQSQTDVVMLSWGKQGVGGDKDPDNACTIEFFIDYDTNGDDLPDFAANDPSGLRTAASTNGTSSTGTHQIVASLVEDPEGKALSYYAWNFKDDFKATNWLPADETVSINGYHIYGIISEGSTLTERVVCLGVTVGGESTTFQAGVATPRPSLIEFNLAQPYVKLFDPPQKGVTVSGDETYRLNFNAFDWGYNANVGIFAVKKGAGEIVANGNFNNGQTGWIPAVVDDWVFGSGVAAHATGNATTVSQAFATVAATPYDYSFEIKDATAGNIAITIGGVAVTGSPFATNGVYHITQTPGVSAAGIVITPALTFDGSIDNISVKPSGLTDGAITTTVTAITALPAGNSYCLTSTTGTVAAGAWLTENTATYYDMTLRLPSDVAVRYTTDLAANVTSLTDGDYWVYIGAGTLGAAPIGATTLYRAPGVLAIKNLTETAPQRNLLMSPMSFVSTVGDTTRILINAADEGGNVDLIDLYIAVEKQYFELMTTTNPFTDADGYGTLIANEAIDDSANGRWILHATVFNSGNVINPIVDDMGNTVASFLVKGKGTNATEGRTSSIYFINEPVRGWVTDFKNDGTSLSFASSNANVKVRPRAIVEGVLNFQGRVYSNFIVNFDLRKRGSYEATTDSVFINRNDGAIADSTYKLAPAVYSPSGIQYKLDTEGKFTLTNVPTGDWELIVSYPRYLAKMQTINLNPGLDSLFVNFGELLGGDAIGYTDSLGDVYPNNSINQTDINRISEAYLSTPDSSRWATAVDPISNGKYNYKWADINEDNIIEIQDLTIATGNFLYGGQANIGAQPVYMKPAAGSLMSNENAIVELTNIPSELKAGQSYTLQVVVNNAADVKGYYVSMDYDSSDLSFSNIENGNFIDAQSQAFPVIGNEMVGFANAVYGPSKFSGSGILAEVTFTALHDGVFSANMISLTEASFVNSNFIKEEAITSQPTGVDSGSVPVVFNLDQNYPNPFNPSTTISFAVPENGHVSVSIYDVLGRKVRTLVDNQFTAGKYSVVWDAKDGNGNAISAGVYMYAINAGKYQATKRMLFLK